MYIFTFDPGKTTGWALAEVDDGDVINLQYGEDAFYEICTRMDEWFKYYGHALKPVGEKYTITQRTAQLSQQHDALEIIGNARYLAWKHDCQELTLQPTNTKKFSTDRRLKAMGWWYKGGGGHANDALRHLMGYLVSIGWMDDRIT